MSMKINAFNLTMATVVLFMIAWCTLPLMKFYQKQVPSKANVDSIKLIQLKIEFVNYKNHIMDSLSQDLVERDLENVKLTKLLSKVARRIEQENSEYKAINDSLKSIATP